MKKRPLAAFAILIVLAALTSVALARPGGGESFSGGGGHGGGGSGSDTVDGVLFVLELIYYLIELFIYYPTVMLPLLAIVIIFIIVNAVRQHQNKDWDSGPPVELHRAIPAPPDDVPELDPDFSLVVFEDFAFRLFATAQRARNDLEKLTAAVGPYMAQPIRSMMVMGSGSEVVQQVVVGAQRVTDMTKGDDAVTIEVEYEANIATAAHTYYTVEVWTFSRALDVKSKPPRAAHTFPCPNCGAPWDAKSTGAQQCSSCGQIVDNGRFDWVVTSTETCSSDERPPTLTTDVPERGTDLPTYRQPGVDAKWDALVADDPAVSQTAFNGRIQLIYGGLNEAWSKNELEPVRGLVTDSLFDYLQYWVEAYKRQGLRNQLSNMRIERMETAKVARDKYYDAVTVRIWGTGLDYVIDTAGTLVRGSKHRERPYSEYWTFVRSATRKGPPRAEPVCSNCGAPLKITQGGTCDHCGAHVTSGEFDWVLSKIEQDDTYRG